MSDILLVFALSVAVVFILWCLMGLLLMPVFSNDMVTFCFSKGNGGKLEQQVRAYNWLRDGYLSGGRFVIVDCGLNAEGLAYAQVLRSRYDWVGYCPRQVLSDYVELLEDTI